MSAIPAGRPAREATLLSTLSVVGIVPWLLFHLWEQWAALSGRAAWLERMHATSGPAMRPLEVLVAVVVPLALLVLALRSIAAGRPLPGHAVDEGDGALVRFLSRASRPALLGTIAFLAVHAGWLWAGHATDRASALEVYEELRIAAGIPAMLIVHALGLVAVAVHVAASIPAFLVTVGLVDTHGGRRSAALVGSGFSACLLVLAVQLYGWHATGTGTVWPVRVVDETSTVVPAEEP